MTWAPWRAMAEAGCREPAAGHVAVRSQGACLRAIHPARVERDARVATLSALLGRAPRRAVGSDQAPVAYDLDMALQDPPSTMSAAELDGALTLTRRWLAPDAAFPMVFGAVWIGFLFVWLRGVTAVAPLFALLATGHVVVGLVLVYASACRVLNRTTVRVAGGRLEVTHGPLPVWGRLGRRSFAIEGLTQLYTRQPSDGRAWWWGMSFEIVGRIGDDVLDLVDVRTREEASFVERAIEEHLHIIDDGRTLDAAPIPRPRSIAVLSGDDPESAGVGYRESERATGALVLRVRWPRSGVAFDLVFAAGLGALAAYAATGEGADQQVPGVLLLALIAAGCGYRGLANLLGHTRIQLDATRLAVTHGPLPIPFRRGLDVSTEEVRSFVAAPKPTQRNKRWVSANVQLDRGAFEVAPTTENDEVDYPRASPAAAALAAAWRARERRCALRNDEAASLYMRDARRPRRSRVVTALAHFRGCARARRPVGRPKHPSQEPQGARRPLLEQAKRDRRVRRDDEHGASRQPVDLDLNR